MFPGRSGGISLYANEGWRKYTTLVGPVATFGYWIGWSVVLALFGNVIGSLIQAQWFSSSILDRLRRRRPPPAVQLHRDRRDRAGVAVQRLRGAAVQVVYVRDGRADDDPAGGAHDRAVLRSLALLQRPLGAREQSVGRREDRPRVVVHHDVVGRRGRGVRDVHAGVQNPPGQHDRAAQYCDVLALGLHPAAARPGRLQRDTLDGGDPWQHDVRDRAERARRPAASRMSCSSS